MKKCITILVSLSLLMGCKHLEIVTINNQQFKIPPAPNTTKITDNFYIDETEVANIDYREYQYWIGRVYGFNSQRYADTQLDTTVWRTLLEFNEPFVATYHKHPAYDDYPVVGMTLEQAKNYTAWRTQIVARMHLESKGLIKKWRDDSPESIFTIDKYVNGNYNWIIKKQDIVLPIYRIPTEEEYDMVFGPDYLKFAIDSSKYSRYVKKGYSFANTKIREISKNENDNAHITAPVRAFMKDRNGLFNTIGNVSEIIDKEGLAKGGNWMMRLKNTDFVKGQSFTAPNSYTGFRNFCSWELFKVNQETTSSR